MSKLIVMKGRFDIRGMLSFILALALVCVEQLIKSSSTITDLPQQDHKTSGVTFRALLSFSYETSRRL